MDVAVTELRAHLSSWLRRVSEGEQLVVTDHGVPVARLIGVDSAGLIERLTEQGVIAQSGRATRPRAAGLVRARTRKSVADLVSEQRR